MKPLFYRYFCFLLVFTSFALIACSGGIGENKSPGIIPDFSDAEQTVKAVAPDGTDSVIITFQQITDVATNAIAAPIAIIHQFGTPSQVDVIVSGSFSNQRWYIDGVEKQANVNSIVMDAADASYNSAGIHFLTFVGSSGGRQYIKTVPFEIQN